MTHYLQHVDLNTHIRAASSAQMKSSANRGSLRVPKPDCHPVAMNKAVLEAAENVARELQALQDEYILMNYKEGVPHASRLMNQSWGQLVMFDSLHASLKEEIMSKATEQTRGRMPVTVDLKRSLMDDHVDQAWQQALNANKMSRAADRSRRMASHARRDAAARVIQVCYKQHRIRMLFSVEVKAKWRQLRKCTDVKLYKQVIKELSERRRLTKRDVVKANAIGKKGWDAVLPSLTRNLPNIKLAEGGDVGELEEPAELGQQANSITWRDVSSDEDDDGSRQSSREKLKMRKQSSRSSGTSSSPTRKGSQSPTKRSHFAGYVDNPSPVEPKRGKNARRPALAKRLEELAQPHKMVEKRASSVKSPTRQAANHSNNWRTMKAAGTALTAFRNDHGMLAVSGRPTTSDQRNQQERPKTFRDLARRTELLKSAVNKFHHLEMLLQEWVDANKPILHEIFEAGDMSKLDDMDEQLMAEMEEKMQTSAFLVNISGMWKALKKSIVSARDAMDAVPDGKLQRASTMSLSEAPQGEEPSYSANQTDDGDVDYSCLDTIDATRMWHQISNNIGAGSIALGKIDPFTLVQRSMNRVQKAKLKMGLPISTRKLQVLDDHGNLLQKMPPAPDSALGSTRTAPEGDRVGLSPIPEVPSLVASARGHKPTTTVTPNREHESKAAIPEATPRNADEARGLGSAAETGGLAASLEDSPYQIHGVLDRGDECNQMISTANPSRGLPKDQEVSLPDEGDGCDTLEVSHEPKAQSGSRFPSESSRIALLKKAVLWQYPTGGRGVVFLLLPAPFPGTRMIGKCVLFVGAGKSDSQMPGASQLPLFSRDPPILDGEHSETALQRQRQDDGFKRSQNLQRGPRDSNSSDTVCDRHSAMDSPCIRPNTISIKGKDGDHGAENSISSGSVSDALNQMEQLSLSKLAPPAAAGEAEAFMAGQGLTSTSSRSLVGLGRCTPGDTLEEHSPGNVSASGAHPRGSRTADRERPGSTGNPSQALGRTCEVPERHRSPKRVLSGNTERFPAAAPHGNILPSLQGAQGSSPQAPRNQVQKPRDFISRFGPERPAHAHAWEAPSVRGCSAVVHDEPLSAASSPRELAPLAVESTSVPRIFHTASDSGGLVHIPSVQAKADSLKKIEGPLPANAQPSTRPWTESVGTMEARPLGDLHRPDVEHRSWSDSFGRCLSGSGHSKDPPPTRENQGLRPWPMHSEANSISGKGRAFDIQNMPPLATDQPGHAMAPRFVPVQPPRLPHTSDGAFPSRFGEVPPGARSDGPRKRQPSQKSLWGQSLQVDEEQEQREVQRRSLIHNMLQQSDQEMPDTPPPSRGWFAAPAPLNHRSGPRSRRVSDTDAFGGGRLAPGDPLSRLQMTLPEERMQPPGAIGAHVPLPGPRPSSRGAASYRTPPRSRHNPKQAPAEGADGRRPRRPSNLGDGQPAAALGASPSSSFSCGSSVKLSTKKPRSPFRHSMDWDSQRGPLGGSLSMDGGSEPGCDLVMGGSAQAVPLLRRAKQPIRAGPS